MAAPLGPRLPSDHALHVLRQRAQIAQQRTLRQDPCRPPQPDLAPGVCKLRTCADIQLCEDVSAGSAQEPGLCWLVVPIASSTVNWQHYITCRERRCTPKKEVMEKAQALILVLAMAMLSRL